MSKPHQEEDECACTIARELRDALEKKTGQNEAVKAMFATLLEENEALSSDRFQFAELVVHMDEQLADAKRNESSLSKLEAVAQQLKEVQVAAQQLVVKEVAERAAATERTEVLDHFLTLNRALKDRHRMAENDLADVAKQLADAEAELATEPRNRAGPFKATTSELTRIQSEHAAAIRALEAERKKTIAAELRAKEAEKGRANNIDESSLRAELAGKTKSLNAAKARLADVKTELDAKDTSSKIAAKQAKRQIDKLVKERDAMKVKLGRIEASASQVGALKTTVARQTKDLARKDLAIDDWGKKWACTVSEREDEYAEIQALTRDNKRLADQYSTLEAKYKKLKAKK